MAPSKRRRNAPCPEGGHLALSPSISILRAVSVRKVATLGPMNVTAIQRVRGIDVMWQTRNMDKKI